ncbi:threonine dehydratase I, partial [Caulochytrium protostelioides]
IFVPIGGGGIAAGIGAYVKRIAPHVRIIGVETYDADSMTQALRCGAPTTLRQVGLFADGTAVRRVGSETYRLCQQYLDETILVNTDETCAAIKDIFEDTRGIVEPSGALATAGCKKYLQMRGLTNKKCVVIASGANMSFERLRFVAERAGLGENREALINVVIPEKPGSFLRLHDIIAPRPVTEFSYRYGDSDRAHIFMSFVVKDRDAELRSIFAQLEQNEMEALDASENEFAKAHARYLVGGRRVVPDERVFRFSFPERPGALNHFLQQLMAPGGWNISLFHYRNYGGDVGKVMAGIQVPPASAGNFNKFLSDLRYPYVEETNNPFYRNFLQ